MDLDLLSQYSGLNIIPPPKKNHVHLDPDLKIGSMALAIGAQLVGVSSLTPKCWGFNSG